MRSARFFIYGIILTLCVVFYPTSSRYPCGKLDSLFQKYLDQGFAFLAFSEMNDGNAATFMITKDNTLDIIVTDMDLNACTVMSFPQFQFIMYKRL